MTEQKHNDACGASRSDAVLDANVSGKCMLKHLRIVRDRGENIFYVAYGEGPTFKSFGAALSFKAAQSMIADIRKRPWYYGL